MSAGPKAIAKGVAAIEATNRRTHTRLIQVDDDWWHEYNLSHRPSPFGELVEVDLPFLVAEVLNSDVP